MNDQALSKSLSFRKSFLQRYGLLSLMLAFSLILSLYRIKECYPWIDEFFSIFVAQRPIAWIWNLELAPAKFTFNTTPPLYETILHFFWDASGENLLAPRLLSIFFYLAALIALFSLAKLLFGQTVAQLTVFLASLNYAYMYYGKMIRCYSFLNALGLISLYLYLKLVKEDIFKRRYLIGLACVNIMILYTFYFGAFVILMEILLSRLFFTGKRLQQMQSWLASAFIFFIPWMPRFLVDIDRESAFVYQSGIVLKNFWPALIDRIKNGIFWDGTLSALYVLIFIGLSIYGWRRFQKARQDGLRILGLVVILAASISLINLLTTFIPEASRARYLFMFIFPFFILASLAIARSPKVIGICLFLLLTFSSAKTALSYLNSPRDQFWPTDMPFPFAISPSEKAVMEIEDALFVPIFVYNFYGPRYFYDVSVPWNGHGLEKLQALKPNYKVYFSVAGDQKQRLLESIPAFAQADWLFIIYHRNGMLDELWGKPFKDFYWDKLKAYGLENALMLVDAKISGITMIELYRVKKPESMPDSY